MGSRGWSPGGVWPLLGAPCPFRRVPFPACALRASAAQRAVRGCASQDFASLFQHPPNGKRTEAEGRLFKQGLAGLASLYAHQYTTVFRLTRMPNDYPAAYRLLKGANFAAYEERGCRGPNTPDSRVNFFM